MLYYFYNLGHIGILVEKSVPTTAQVFLQSQLLYTRRDLVPVESHLVILLVLDSGRGGGRGVVELKSSIVNC